MSLKQSHLLADLEIPLGVELGEFSLSGEEFLSLTPGEMFDFIFDASKTLTLRVAGEAIGKARFVKDGEKLLLEIVEVSFACEK